MVDLLMTARGFAAQRPTRPHARALHAHPRVGRYALFELEAATC